MAENISPEERLFNVIQRGKQPAAGSGDPGDKKPGGWMAKLKRFFPASRPSSHEGKKSFNWKTIFPASIQLPEIEPGAINKALVAALIISTVFFIHSFLVKQKDASQIAQAVSKISISSSLGLKKEEPLKGLAYYLGEIQNRDIFHPAPKNIVVGVKREASESLKKAAESLKLAGISWGDTPKAMILRQDDKDGKMYFVTQGQPIGQTGIIVQEIHRNKVKISDGKEEMELL